MRKTSISILCILIVLTVSFILLTALVYNTQAEDVTSYLDLPAGWSMISLPVIPYNASVSLLFPEAVVVYFYNKGFGYVRVKGNEEMEVGKGYWILIDQNQDYAINGQLIEGYSHIVDENGWDMIGGCSDSTQASLCKGDIKVVYGYIQGSGYTRIPESENLQPGKGYWILLTDITQEDVFRVGSVGDMTDIINTFDPNLPRGCGCCHDDPDISVFGKLHSTIEEDMISCKECHGNDHRIAKELRRYLDDYRKCKYCHGDPPGINVLCNGISVNAVHPPGATNCQACHPGVYNKTSKHYQDAGDVNIEQSWEGQNSCGICHSDVPVVACGGVPSSIHALLEPGSNCAQCHSNHCEMNYGDSSAKCIACHSPNPAICDICGPGSIVSHYAFDSMGVNQTSIQDCLSCHVEPITRGEANPLEHIDNPQTFVKEEACLGCHSLARTRHGATAPQECYSCHPTHCVTEYARNDACIWCHTTNPPIVDICKMGIGITSHLAFDSSAFNQIQITNCIGCHVEPLTGGEANPINHIDNPMTHVNPLTCMGCHTVVVPHGGSGLPWADGVWPNVNCYSCHPTHCVSTFCDNQACIWCHTDAPLLQNVCGKPGLVPHTGDCINCHTAEVPTEGECNPVDHMNGLTYVRDGTCLGCHANVTTTHGPGTETCMLCHPVHCSFTYCSEPQCELCHNQPTFEVVSDYGCGIGLHDPPAYKECSRCHAGECNPQNHTLGPTNSGMPTDLSGMRLEWRDCGLCHSEAQAYHAPCNAPCTLCHSGTSIHACVNLDYCAENKCRCCHIDIPFHSNTQSDCSTCHSAECDPLEHDITGVSTNHPMDSLYYNYTEIINNKGFS